jgi:hypothetical protein
MSTPNGTMLSLVMQQGDCNASATFQMIMTSIFAPYISVFLEVYLDDIFIFLDTLNDHIKHIQLVALSKWKTPMNRDLLRGFLGSTGYLADDIDHVRIPMGILSELTGDTVPYRWEYTHQ